jgi:NADH dehydrogenase [ubiquinone] 1 alpha subcomplex assembly factor 1
VDANAASEKILFDFQASSDFPAWQIVNDDVMGGASTSRFQGMARDGAVFSGRVSLVNNGGFASVRSPPIEQNLKGCDVFVLRVRGDGRCYKFTVRTEAGTDTPRYQCVLATKRGEWQDHSLNLKDFAPTFRGRALNNVPPLDASRITLVGFLISDKQDGPFRLEIALIKASPAM